MAQDDFIQSAFKELHLRSAEDAGGFHVSSMNECLDKARSLPPLVTLYPNVVLEGDLCVIFGQSGIGKTIFAMQVARDIAASGRRVLYADFEMTPRQLALRYGTADFPLTLFRAEMDTDNLPEDILKGIEEAALANQTDVVFIDNITPSPCLCQPYRVRQRSTSSLMMLLVLVSRTRIRQWSMSSSVSGATAR